MIMALSFVVAAIGATAPTMQVKTLQCGALDLRMSSHMPASADVLAPVRQTLTRRVGPRQVRVALEPSRTILMRGQRVNNRYVVSWACVTGRRATAYVLIGYACAVDPGYPNDCGGKKEWFRLLDRRGRFVDAGIPTDGIVRDRLNAKLGIKSALAEGVTMTAVVE